MPAEYTITPLVVAFGIQREMSRFTYLNSPGVKFDIPYVSFLLQSGKMNILVDSGCSAEDYKRWIKPAGDEPLQLAGEQFRDVEDAVTIEERLKNHGLAVDDIDILVQTHLDWDHCMNTLKFRKSRIVIQKTEIEDQPVHPLYRASHPPDEIHEEYLKLNLEVVDGNVNLLDGLDLLLTPGHTAGGQSLLVRTPQGPYVIAGLCTTYANYYIPDEEKKKLGYDVIPPGMHISAVDAYESVKLLLEIGGDRILPLHEPSLADLRTIE